ncbi:MAG TPA: R3H domain-containing nucleic acid-binding protein [Patescibacteria group bacterium]|nr:R3H domain-containing nucleic acid-binding protein [Patescibacteria group bacterium]
MNAEQKQHIEELAQQFFSLLGIQAACKITNTDEESVTLAVDAEETGMLIGFHGETLEALQLVFSLFLAKQLGEFTRVSLEIGEYRHNREEWLKQLVEQTKERALSEHRGIALSNLKSWERRFVHMMLKDDAEVVSESMGEGRDRALTISPKN